MKTIEIKTFGIRWGLYPSSPPDNVLQHVVDVRGMMDDPANSLPLKPGTDSEISEWILGQLGVSEWLERERQQIRYRVSELESREGITILRVYYHCRGGFQRSPAVGEAIATWLQREFDKVYHITVQHLTLNLAMATKTAQVQAD